jgi:hypothetical protein
MRAGQSRDGAGQGNHRALDCSRSPEASETSISGGTNEVSMDDVEGCWDGGFTTALD